MFLQSFNPKNNKTAQERAAVAENIPTSPERDLSSSAHAENFLLVIIQEGWKSSITAKKKRTQSNETDKERSDGIFILK